MVSLVGQTSGTERITCVWFSIGAVLVVTSVLGVMMTELIGVKCGQFLEHAVAAGAKGAGASNTSLARKHHRHGHYSHPARHRQAGD